MWAELFCQSGPFRGTSHRILGEVVIGRDDANQIILYEGTISSRHARIFPEKDGTAFLIEDLGSLNGTWLDGIRVGDVERLGALHVITFADDVDFFFRSFPGDPPVAESTPCASAEEGDNVDRTFVDEEPPVWSGAPPAQEEEAASDHTVLDYEVVLPPTLEETPDEERQEILVLRSSDAVWRLAKGSWKVGRVEEVEVTLTDPSVSREHAQLDWNGLSLGVRDLGSINGTYVGDTEVEARIEVSVPVVLRFGTVDIRVEREAENGE